MVEFPHQKCKIRYNPLGDSFQNTIFGTMSHQLTGPVIFNYVDCEDENLHKISARIDIGKDSKLPQDCFSGAITVDGKVVSEIKGSYLGYFEIDGVRYWDVRE